jgi:hypothetical protein
MGTQPPCAPALRAVASVQEFTCRSQTETYVIPRELKFAAR